MKQDVVVHQLHLVEINGWVFNFKSMVANRIKHMENSRNCVQLIYLADRGCITSSARDLKDLHPPTTSNHGTWDWSTWFSFFVPPEHAYNQMIDDAYQTYLLELALRS